MNNSKTVIEITPKTIAITLFMIVMMFVAWQLISVIFMFFVAFIFSAAFKPFVNWAEKYKIPRSLSTIFVLLTFLIIVILGFITVISQALSQLTILIQQLPNIVVAIINMAEDAFPVISEYVDANVVKQSLSDGIAGLLNYGPGIISTGAIGALDVVKNTFSSALVVLMVFVLSAFMLIRKSNVYDGLLKLVSKQNRNKYRDLIEVIETKLSDWLRTQLFIMVLVGLVTWAGLLLPSLFTSNNPLSDFALPIAFLALLLEILPGTGIGLAGVLAALIALASGNIYLTLFYGIFFIAFQQMQTLYILPNVMNKIVGIDPILMILGLFAFLTIFGPIGIVLVVPLLIVMQYLIDFGVDGVIDHK